MADATERRSENGYLIDLTGRKVGNLTILRFSHQNKKTRQFYWECQCTCGATSLRNGLYLRQRLHGKKENKGWCVNCRKERKKHGLWKTEFYSLYDAMISRCYRQHKNTHNYADRGIKVCSRWLNGDGTLSGIECFALDMGPRPSKKHSLERIDNNKGYSPKNCKWATQTEQMANTRTTIRVRFFGELVPWVSICGKLGLDQRDLNRTCRLKKMKNQEAFDYLVANRHTIRRAKKSRPRLIPRDLSKLVGEL